MIYLDNAATSYPKPFCVINALTEAMSLYGANPGRSGHDMSVATSAQVYAVREKLASFFNCNAPENVSFTQNCTHSLNLAIKGLVSEGDHVLISSLEHNSVLRPVHALAERGIITYDVFNVYDDDNMTLSSMRGLLKANTKLVAVTAVSNVTGRIMPLKRLSAAAHNAGALFLVDGAQGAGVVNIDMLRDGIDCLCVPGHKGLYGPMGTGALLHRGLEFSTVMEGGTGTSSALYSQPPEYPERLESGTVNVPGIIALGCGIDYINQIGIKYIFDDETHLCRMLFDGLKNTDGVKVCDESYNSTFHAPLLSFNVGHLHSERVAYLLNDGGFAVRGGFHCSPLAHKTLNTMRTGTVRVSPSINNSEKDINNLLNLVRKIAIRENL